MSRRLTRSAVATIAAAAACALGAMSILSAQAVEAPRPAPAKPAAPAPASQPAAAGQAGPSAPSSGPTRRGAGGTAAPKVAFEKHVLPNGLQLILHVDRKLPIVHVNQWFHVGSKNEKPRRTGFAHLFEHLMFQGSKHVPGEYFSLDREDGRQPPRGRRQRHHQHRPHQLLRDRAVGQPRDAAVARVGPAGDAARRDRQKKLDNQRDVVKNERRQGFENPPYGRWPTSSSSMNSRAGRASLLVDRSSAAWRT